MRVSDAPTRPCLSPCKLPCPNHAQATQPGLVCRPPSYQTCRFAPLSWTLLILNDLVSKLGVQLSKFIVRQPQKSVMLKGVSGKFRDGLMFICGHEPLPAMNVHQFWKACSSRLLNEACAPQGCSSGLEESKQDALV